MTGVAELIHLETEPGEASEASTLRQALIESRQRWRQFGALSTDLLFETDVHGRLSFLAPDLVLGWSATELLGRPASTLLLDPAAPDLFAAVQPNQRRSAWLRNRLDEPVCMAISSVPMTDEHGEFRGTRGVAVDVTAQEHANIVAAAANRRSEVLNHILNRMRQEVLAPRMMHAMLEALIRPLGALGTAAVDLLRLDQPADSTWILHATAPHPPLMLEIMANEMAGIDDEIREVELPDGSHVIACACTTRFGERAALTAWRAANSRPWDVDDRTLLGSVAGIMRIVREHECIQRELALQARTDPLTGLLNRRAFLDEATRRLDRLERDSLPGTLMFLDLDRLKQINDEQGHEAGDSALVLVSAMLNRIFRPSDLIARLGGDEFAVWLDGADSLTAAERAEELRLTTPLELAHLVAPGSEPPGMSIGIAMRDPRSGETLDQVIQRADVAMYEVKRAGRGNWRVSQPSAAV